MTVTPAPETISRFRNSGGAHQDLKGSRDLTTPLSGTVCHPWASTCYCQPTYQIWSL